MSRRYTDEEKKRILDHLAANAGDIALTSLQTGISRRTLYHWQKTHIAKVQAQNVQPQLPQFVQQDTAIIPTNPSLPMHGEGIEGITNRGFARETDDPFDWQTLHTLLDELTQDALHLAGSLHEVIKDAPLNQRASALSQLIDRIMKLAALLPPPKTEQIFRIQYVDTDGSIHETPYWAEEDSSE